MSGIRRAADALAVMSAAIKIVVILDIMFYLCSPRHAPRRRATHGNARRYGEGRNHEERDAWGEKEPCVYIMASKPNGVLYYEMHASLDVAFKRETRLKTWERTSTRRPVASCPDLPMFSAAVT